jgi:integrase
MASFGLQYSEYLEIASHPNSEGYRQRYRGRDPPDPVRVKDAAIIRQYLDERTAQGMGAGTAKVVATYLCMIARKFPGYDTMDNGTVNRAFQYLRSMKQNTQRRAIPLFKNFIRWMNEEKVNAVLDISRISKIKTPGLDTETKKASDMLNGDEIRRLIDVAGNERDRALIAFLFEGALRPIEASAATWGDLQFDQYGASFSTSKKTGKSRYIRLIWSGSLLKAWANKYPGEPKGNNPVFVSAKTPQILKQIEVTTIRSLFYSLLKKAGIDKKISPYHLRHSRITSMMADEIPESVIKMQAWGSMKSNMLATYAHITNKDIDRILLTRAGIITNDKDKPDELRARQCPTCGKVHGPTTKFCDECGTSLAQEFQQNIQAKTQAIEQSPRHESDIDKILSRMNELEDQVKKLRAITA